MRISHRPALRPKDIHLSVVHASLLSALPAVGTAGVVGVRQHVEGILLLIGGTLVNPEEDTTDEGDDSHGSVQPHEEGISRKSSEGLSKSVGES